MVLGRRKPLVLGRRTELFIDLKLIKARLTFCVLARENEGSFSLGVSESSEEVTFLPVVAWHSCPIQRIRNGSQKVRRFITDRNGSPGRCDPLRSSPTVLTVTPEVISRKG